MAVDVGTAVAYLDLNITAFNSNLAQAQSSLQSLTSDSTTAGQKISSVGNTLTSVGSSLTRSVTVPIVNAGKSIVEFGSTFDRSMSNVKSVMQPTEAEFEILRDAAIDWGRQTVYTADESAQALYYMGLAGWDANESASALGGVLNLAAAGQLDLARTSDIVTDAMSAFHMSADGVSEGVNSADWFVNLLAATMSNSNTTVDMLGESFKYVASAVGGIESPMYSAEQASRDTALMLGILANNGIKSSQAGTTLRRVILNLEKPTDTVKSGLDGLNLTLDDVNMTTNGVKGVMDNFRGAVRELLPYLDEQQIAQLQVSESLSEEEAQMQLYNQTLDLVEQGVIDTTQQQVLMNIAQVAGAYAVSGMTALIMTQQDEYDNLYHVLENSNEMFVKHEDQIYTMSEAYDLFGDDIYDATKGFEILGAAEGMAQVQNDNLQGSWIILMSAIDTLKIKLNDLVKDSLQALVEKITDVVNWFIDLDPEMQKNIIKWGLILAAVGPVIMIFGSFLKSIGIIVEAFKIFSPIVKTVTTIIGQMHAETSIAHGVMGLLKEGISSLFTPMTGWIALIALVIAAIIDLWRNNEDFRESVTRIWNAIKDLLVGIWEAIKPIIDAAIELIGAIIKALEPLIEALFRVLAPIIEGIIALLKPMLALIGEVIAAVIRVATAVIEFLTPVIEFVTGVFEIIFTFIAEFLGLVEKVLGFLLGKFVEGLKKVGDFWESLWNGVVKVWQATFGRVIDSIKLAVNLIVEAFKWLKYVLIGDPIVLDMLNGISGAFKAGFEFILNIVKTILEAIVKVFEWLWEAAKKVVDGIMNVFEKGFHAILDFVSGVFEGIANFVNTAIEKIGGFLSNMVENILGWFSNLATNLGTVIGNIVGAFSDGFSRVKEAISNIFGGIRESFVSFRDKVVNVALEVGKGFIDAIKGGKESIEDFFKDYIGEAIKAIKDKIGDMKDAAKEFMGGFLDGLKSKWDSIIDWFKGLWDTIKNLWNNSLPGKIINTVGGAIGNLFDGSHADGLAYVPFDGYVAQLHQGERVLTAEENRRYSNGGSNGDTTINFYSNEKIDEYTAARELRRTVHDIKLGLV